MMVQELMNMPLTIVIIGQNLDKELILEQLNALEKEAEI